MWELPKFSYRDMKWANVVGTMVPIDWLNSGFAANIQLVKKKSAVSAKSNKAKPNERRYACSYILLLSMVIALLKLSIILKKLFSKSAKIKHKHTHVKWKLDNTESKKVSSLSFPWDNKFGSHFCMHLHRECVYT